MKKILLFTFLWFSVLYAHAQQTYTWAVTSGDLDAPGSWSPARTSPAATDILAFNGSVQSTATVTNIPLRETIGKLVISNNCSVSFTSGASSTGAGTIARSGVNVTGSGTSFNTDFVTGDVINLGAASNEVASVTSATSLTTTASGTVAAGTAYTEFARIKISGGSNALSIEAGSSLTISATSSISLYIAAGSTGSISGSLSFSNAAHRLNVNDANGVTFNSGSTFTQGTSFSGNAFTATTAVPNTVVFANGSTCSVGAGSNPFALSAPASKVTFNSGSMFVQTSGAPSFSGRTYADFKLSTGSSQTVTGSSAVSINNLIITGNSTLSWGMTGTPGHAIKGDITVNSGSTLTFAPLAAGTVNLNGTAAQTITGGGTITFGNNTTVVNGNTAGITVAAGTRINLVTGGTLNLNSKPFIFQSTAAGTASIGPITGTLSNATNVTVQRYIPAHAARAYTLVAPGVNGTTMYNSWQEGGASTPGYGTQISGIYAGNGFDFASSSGTSSVFDYNDEQNPGAKWESLGTGTYVGYGPINVPFYPGQGWLLFVRGDRTVGAGSAAPSATTLRATGSLTTGTVDFINLLDPNANKFTLIGNPYACPISWNTTSKTALSGSFTVYDPNLLSFVTSDGTTVSPNISQQQANVIQSGQAFFVQTDNSGNQPDFVVNETDKITTASSSIGNTVFVAQAPVTQLNVNFYKDNNTFVDGMVAVFDDSYKKNQDPKDAVKFTNFGETISFAENNDRSLSIDARPIPQASDTLVINTKQMTVGARYNVVIDGKGFNGGNLRSAILVDKVTGIKTSLDLSGTSSYSFLPNAATETGRLYIVLSNTPTAALVSNTNTTSNDGLSVTLLENPTKDEVRLRYAAKQAGNTTIRLINVNGYPFNKQDLGTQQQGSVTIPLSGHAVGLYLVEVKVGNAVVISKVIKQ